MGTSSSSSGSGSGTPLVPTWLDDLSDDSLPVDNDQTPQGESASSNQDDESSSPIPVAGMGRRFQSARGNFSRFAASGGTDLKALRRSVRDYVREGVGGSASASRRMQVSHDTARQILNVLRDLQRDGLQNTLLQFNLQDLSGGTARDIFVGLTEVICRDGGPIDEAIARDAWLETIARLDESHINDLDALTDVQVQELFLAFIAHSIEARLYQEIGVNGFKLSDGLGDIENWDRQFREYIGRAVRDSFAGEISQETDLTKEDISQVVDTTYRGAWELLQQLGDQDEE